MATPQTRAKTKLIAERVLSLVQSPLDLVAQYDNGPFVDKDQIIVSEPKQGEFPVWMAVSIDPSLSFHAEMGGDGRHRTPGTIAIQLFSGLNKGTADAENIVDSIISAFRSTTSDGIIYGTPTRLRGGRSDDEAWWVTPVVIPFSYDD